MTHHSNIKTKSSLDNNMSEAVFDRIANLAHQQAGIVLTRSKESMVKSRLVRRLRALKLNDFETYLDHLDSSQDSNEMSQFISALTTNVSHFFREDHHFELVKSEILPKLLSKLNAGQKVRIWSAGCSNGQEPYSLAMTLLQNAPEISGKDIKILATDIDPEVLRCAKAGEYSGTMNTGLNEATINRFFTASHKDGGEVITINKEVKDLISFRQLNLHSDWPMQGEFDLIFCRNVVIYFDLATQNKLYHRYADILTQDGWLMLGHSERLGEDVDHLFTSVGVTTYQPTKTS